MYRARSCVIWRHSSLLFIFGFFDFIQNASRILRADIFGSCARMVTFISKSTPLCFCALCVPRGVFDLFFVFPSRCSLIRTERGRPVSPIYSSPHILQEIRYTVPEIMQSPFLPWGQTLQFDVSQRRSYMRLRISFWRRVFGGISINVTESSKPALFKHCFAAMLILSEMKGRLNVTLLSLDQCSG